MWYLVNSASRDFESYKGTLKYIIKKGHNWLKSTQVWRYIAWYFYPLFMYEDAIYTNRKAFRYPVREEELREIEEKELMILKEEKRMIDTYWKDVFSFHIQLCLNDGSKV